MPPTYPRQRCEHVAHAADIHVVNRPAGQPIETNSHQHRLGNRQFGQCLRQRDIGHQGMKPFVA